MLPALGIPATFPCCKDIAFLSSPGRFLQLRTPLQEPSCRARIIVRPSLTSLPVLGRNQVFLCPADSWLRSEVKRSLPVVQSASEHVLPPLECEGVESGTTFSSSSFRRTALANLAAASCALWLGEGIFPGDALASQVQKVVKLKDVENAKLQEALRAAVVGDLENAERLFTALIEENPTSASVWSNRGSVRLSMERWEDAAFDLTKATELAPYAPVPFLNRAIAFEAMGRYSEAESDCKTAIENDPEEYAAWFNLGNVEAKLKEYSNALSAYQRAALLAPGIAGYRLREATMLFQLDRVEEAAREMQGLVRKYPTYAEARAALAAVLWRENRRSSAEEQYAAATQQEPRFSSVRWVRESLQWPPGLENALENFLAIK